MQKFREKLADEQELVGGAFEYRHGNLRHGILPACARKNQRARRETATQTMIDAARVFISDAAERVEHEARRVIPAIHEGDMLTTQMSVLKRFGKRAPVDTIALRGA